MSAKNGSKTFWGVAAGVLLGIGLSHFWSGLAGPTVPAALADDVKKTPTLEGLSADLDTVKGKLNDQSHAMADVAYHFCNLWFAADSENWPLADFYFKEAKSHLAWAVRIIPVRKDNAGKEVDLRVILQALENSPFTLKSIEQSIAAKDKDGFVKAYKFTLEGCYSCHKAADKPFIRPHIPAHPDAQIIDFDPNAKWPQ